MCKMVILVVRRGGMGPIVAPVSRIIPGTQQRKFEPLVISSIDDEFYNNVQVHCKNYANQTPWGPATHSSAKSYESSAQFQDPHPPIQHCPALMLQLLLITDYGTTSVHLCIAMETRATNQPRGSALNNLALAFVTSE